MSEIKINSATVIFTGLFRYNEKKVSEKEVYSDFIHWRNRINGGNYADTYRHFNSAYYDTFVNIIYPEIRFEKEVVNVLNNKRLNHLTNKNVLNSDEFKSCNLKTRGGNVGFSIKWADIYHFEQEIAMFTFHCEIADPKIESLSSFIAGMRNITTEFSFASGKEISVKDFISDRLLNGFKIEDESWVNFNPQLKSYTNVDLYSSVSPGEMNDLLFELGTVSPFGSKTVKNSFSPSEQYFQQIINENSISVFDNWKALSLNDTFTRISINAPDKFNSWSNDYFHVYIFCLYLKFYLYLINSELSDVTVVQKRSKLLRNRFIEFINDYNLSHISYKFLPDLLLKKISSALDIQTEIDKMEVKISRLSTFQQEQRDQNLAAILLFITVLNIFSIIFSVSEWGIKLGIDESNMYPVISLSIAALLVIMVIVYMVGLFKRK